MPFRRLAIGIALFFAIGISPLVANPQVNFIDFEDFPRADASAIVGLELCNHQSPDVDPRAPSAQEASTCTAGTGDLVSTTTSSFSAVFTGPEDDVAGASLNASVRAEADAHPINNLSSQSSSDSDAVVYRGGAHGQRRRLKQPAFQPHRDIHGQSGK